jgi:cytochrome c oxidase subunit 1
MWLWTTIGVAAELLFIVIPASLGWTQTVDVGLTRTLFSWTLHPIGYFWLFPAYIAFYTMAPQAAGGRLYSDTMGRLSFALLLVYGLPVGMHHLFMDPEQSTGFKFVQMMLTILVTVPTLLTVFTISASMEIAGRLRGGRGLFGWILALPWERPMVLATGLSFVMLFFGGGSGLVNMGYGLNALIHNTSWVTEREPPHGVAVKTAAGGLRRPCGETRNSARRRSHHGSRRRCSRRVRRHSASWDDPTNQSQS